MWFVKRKVEYFVLTDDTYLDEVNALLQRESAESRSDPVPTVVGDLADNETPLVVVARSGKQFVGAAWASADKYMLTFLRSRNRETTEFKQGLALIHQIVVLPEFQRQGIGSVLLRDLESLLSKRNVKMIALVYCPSKQLTSFYNELGYKTGLTHVKAPLAPGQGLAMPVDDPDRWAQKLLR